MFTWLRSTLTTSVAYQRIRQSVYENDTDHTLFFLPKGKEVEGAGQHKAASGTEEAAKGLWDSQTRGWGTPTFLLISYLYRKPGRTNTLYSLRYFCPVQLCGLAGALLSSHMTHANTAAYDLWRLREKENSQLHYEGASFPEYLFTGDQGTL